MAKYTSEKTIIKASCKDIYTFLSDFNNFEKLMPAQVKNWKSDHDTCSFKIDGLSDLSMKMQNKQENKSINIISFGKNPVDYTLDIFLFKVDEDKCEVVIEFNAELNSFMRMLADKPLQNFVNMLAEKLKELFESGELSNN
jgi:carbon monoxide dehydrogenase subunit G